MSSQSRRTFLKTAGAGVAASAAAISMKSSAKAVPNDRVRHGVIGLGNQGRRHAHAFAALAQCDVVAVCDVDPKRRQQVLQELDGGQRVKAYEDYRQVLEDDAIDSVSVVTPDHWHTPIALAALISGKHVYVEKPCCHNAHEGRVLESAAARFGKCVQHGTQRRSGQANHDAVRYLRDGHLGTVRMAKAINHQLRAPIGRAPETQPPPGVNYDLWTGPATAHPFTRNRWHYNWHWFWDYGTGDIGNDGIHHIDLARWGLGVAYPNVTNASGGQLFYDDDHETPDTQTVIFEFDSCHLVYEMRLWTDYPLEGHDNGVVFYGDNGRLEIGRAGVEVTLIGEEPKKLGGGDDFGDNTKNFIECVAENNPDGLRSPIREGVISATLCHLGNISTRVGRRVRYDPRTGRIPGDDEANELLTRTYRAGYELPKFS